MLFRGKPDNPFVDDHHNEIPPVDADFGYLKLDTILCTHLLYCKMGNVKTAILTNLTKLG